jgi:hypothetical protein
MDGSEILQRLCGRSYRRFELEFPVRLRFEVGSGNGEIEGVSKNVSVGGLLIRSASPVPQQAPVTFTVSVHGAGSLRPVHLRGEGRIIRIESGDIEGTFAIAVSCNSPLTQLEAYLTVQQD